MSLLPERQMGEAWELSNLPTSSAVEIGKRWIEKYFHSFFK
jgi:hypothetical protein